MSNASHRVTDLRRERPFRSHREWTLEVQVMPERDAASYRFRSADREHGERLAAAVAKVRH